MKVSGGKLFPFPASLGLLSLGIQLVIAAIVGGLAGLLIRLALRQARPAMIWDALTGALGFAVGFALCLIVPWSANTIAYSIDDTKLQSTMNAF